jgi:heme-degrading monooxygenase HmoA
MRAFMTTGTAHFLKTITEKHATLEFYLMKRAATTLIYYEDNKKKGIFVSGRAYDVIHTWNKLNRTGFVVMNHIPVSEEEMPLFEARTKKQLTTIQQINGVKAVRLLKEDKSNQYVILIQWQTEKDYAVWEKQSDHALTFSKNTKLPAYFMDRPFTNSYYMLKEDD